MKINILRYVAVTLGLGVCTIANAAVPYSSPAKWNNFRPASDKAATQVKKAASDAVKEAVEELPAPVPAPTPEPAANATPPIKMPEKMPETVGGSDFQAAMSAPWEGTGACGASGYCAPARLPLAPYFGGANLLFLTLENQTSRLIASGVGDFRTSAVNPGGTVGFDATLGRYLHCGRYGLGITYTLWNPGRESLVRTGTAGSIRAEMPTYNAISVDAGSGAEPIYDIIDGSGAYAGAAGVRASRDVRFQGIEANLFGFGLMGASRTSYQCCNSAGLFGGRWGRNRCRGFGGAAGPLVRGCGGRVRIMTSHGFRWFQVEDDFELAYNIDGTAGYQASDLYENIDISNNLYGYQFGARLTYCLTCRLSMNIGGKFGLYGNHAQMRHRVGTQNAIAYRNGAASDLILTESSDSALATLSELDLGLGYRIGCAWTIRGGYRLYGLTGVANAVDSLPTTYVTVADSANFTANDSFVLHGGYCGLEFNW